MKQETARTASADIFRPPVVATRRARAVPLGLLAAASLLAAGAGCGSGDRTYRVEGVVTTTDGAPVAGGIISFDGIDQSTSATARLDERGYFRLGTHQQADGVPAGRYRVVVLPEPIPDPAAGEAPATFHPKYRSYDTSGLEYTVEPKRNYFEIQLDPPP